MPLTEIRLFGSLRVRRADGTYVDTRDLRTSMTRELLALVALRAPNPVPLDEALESIWPGVDPAKSRARLRTAASQIRKVLEANCIQREGHMLVLRDAWVDTRAFELAAAQARVHLQSGDPSAGLVAARQALALCGGEVCEGWRYVDWITQPRAQLRAQLEDLLLAGAEAALKLSEWDQASELAGRAASMTPTSERACRVLMRCYQQLGETQLALSAYERCRGALVRTLGANPSEATESLHRALLRGFSERPPAPFVGREGLLKDVRRRVTDAFAQRRSTLITLVGPPGSGKSRLMDELALGLRARVILVRLDSIQGKRPGVAYQQVMARLGQPSHFPPRQGTAIEILQPTLLCIDDVRWAAQESLDALLCQLSALESPMAVVLATTQPPSNEVLARTVVRLPRLTRPEAEELILRTLGDQLDNGAVEELLEYSDGWPGPLVEEALPLRSSRVVSGEGADAQFQSSGWLSRLQLAEEMLKSVRGRLSPKGLAILDLLAVLDEPVTAEGLEALTGDTSEQVHAALDVLADCHVARCEGDVWSLADSELHAAAYNWLRPSVRRHLHRQVATSDDVLLSRSVRLRHWREAGLGQPALDTPHLSSDRSDGGAISVPVPLTYLLGTAPGERRIRALAWLASAAPMQDGRMSGVFDAVITRAKADAADLLPSLYRRRAELLLPDDDPLAWVELARRGVEEDLLIERSLTERAGGVILERWSTSASLVAHQEAVRLADAAGDLEQRVRTREGLVRTLLAKREVDEAAAVGRAAADIADRTGDDALLARALLAIAMPAIWTGDVEGTIRSLERALSISAGDRQVQAHASRLLARSLHALGEQPDAASALELSHSLSVGPSLRDWHVVAAEHCLERSQLDKARRHLAAVLEDQRGLSALDFTWVQLLASRIHLAGGQLDRASRALHIADLVARHGGVSLLLPEVIARVATFVAGHDPAAASAQMVEATAFATDHAYPREQSILLCCRAKIQLESGQPSTAQAFAKAAADVARRSRLALRVVEAELVMAVAAGDAASPAAPESVHQSARVS